MERAKPADRQRLEAMLTQWKPEYFAQIVQLCEEYDAFEASRGVLRQILGEAVGCLKVIPATPHREALSDLAQFLSQQTDALGVSSR
jgi:geranylgeranyl pyrophosphate synthase